MAETVEEIRKRILGDEAVAEEEKELLPVRVTKNKEVTVQDLMQACGTNPQHPLSKVFAKAVKRRKPTETVVVERIDLEAVLSNVEVVENVTEENGKKVIRKTLGKSLKPVVVEAPAPVEQKGKGSK